MCRVVIMVFFLCMAWPLSVRGQPSLDELWARAKASNVKDSIYVSYLSALQLALLEKEQNKYDSITFDLGKKYVSLGMLDSARVLARRTIKAFEAGSPNHLAPNFYNMLAITYHHQQNLDSAQTYYLKAIARLEQSGDTQKAASIRFNMGNIYLQLRDWAQAAGMFRQLLETIKQTNDSTYLAGVYAALSSTEYELGHMDTSARFAEQGLDIARKRQDPLGQMLSLRQLGSLALKTGQPAEALAYFSETAQWTEKLGNPYYKALVQLGFAETYFALQDYDKSITAGLASLTLAKDAGYATQLPSVYQVLSDAYAKKGNFKEALEYLTLANEYRHKQINEDNKRVVNELLVQYQTLNKDQQLTDQRLTLQNAVYQKRLYLLFALMGLLMTGSLMVVLLQRQKLNSSGLAHLSQKFEAQLLNAVIEGEETERQRIAMELHDAVSNSLFACKLSLSAQLKKQHLDTEALQQSILIMDQIQTNTRHLAHNLMPVELEKTDLFTTVQKYITGIDRLTSSISITCQLFGKGMPKLNPRLTLILFRSLQGLVGNAIKHASATEIDVAFYVTPKQLRIAIDDNGVGFNADASQWGWGLKSMQERLRLIGADLDIVSDMPGGTQAVMIVPIS